MLRCYLQGYDARPSQKPLYAGGNLAFRDGECWQRVADAESKSNECGGTPATPRNIVETLICGLYPRERTWSRRRRKRRSVKLSGQTNCQCRVTIVGTDLTAIEAGQMPPEEIRARHQLCSKLFARELLCSHRCRNLSHLPLCPKCWQQCGHLRQDCAKCRHEDATSHIFREVCGAFLSEEQYP